eukprot:s4352_g4.t1
MHMGRGAGAAPARAWHRRSESQHRSAEVSVRVFPGRHTAWDERNDWVDWVDSARLQWIAFEAFPASRAASQLVPGSRALAVRIRIEGEAGTGSWSHLTGS